jgi:hypothetical protein
MAATSRPVPLREAARIWSLIIGPAAGVITALVSGGALTVEQGMIIESGFTNTDLLVSAVIGLLAWSGTAAGSFLTAKTAEPKVTPSSDPRGVDPLDPQGRLVKLVPATTVPGVGE